MRINIDHLQMETKSKFLCQFLKTMQRLEQTDFKNWNIIVSLIIHMNFDHAWAEHYPVTLTKQL